ncbi:hypothetical protein BJ085DRAFT_41441 [Dimargaris cristalligena]|uniref:WH2 domain-containing protein n=1 Tax=Dimargaris cristalligena TaxID=215637 RepID=A0A4P9ZYD6_9FUNG|nr:hypothetical protein BJ085DRAFT_41441 [Dimargaris cristalligena]|eukprot:RKP38378.1 hypothetical protein BJ085DRAFT_41441 [Dimargaris cristalligena]
MRFFIPATLALIASATLVLVLAHPLPSSLDYNPSQVSPVHLVRRARKSGSISKPTQTRKSGGTSKPAQVQKSGGTNKPPQAQNNIGVKPGNTGRLIDHFDGKPQKPAPAQQLGKVQAEVQRIENKISNGGTATVKPN